MDMSVLADMARRAAASAASWPASFNDYVDDYMDNAFAGATVISFQRLGRTISHAHALIIVRKLMPSKAHLKKTGAPDPGHTPHPTTYEEAGTFLAKWVPEALDYKPAISTKKISTKKTTPSSNTKAPPSMGYKCHCYSGGNGCPHL